MRIIAEVVLEHPSATGAQIALYDAQHSGRRLGLCSLFSIRLPSGNRLLDDGDRAYIREFARALAQQINAAPER